MVELAALPPHETPVLPCLTSLTFPWCHVGSVISATWDISWNSFYIGTSYTEYNMTRLELRNPMYFATLYSFLKNFALLRVILFIRVIQIWTYFIISLYFYKIIFTNSLKIINLSIVIKITFIIFTCHLKKFIFKYLYNNHT